MQEIDDIGLMLIELQNLLRDKLAARFIIFPQIS